MSEYSKTFHYSSADFDKFISVYGLKNRLKWQKFNFQLFYFKKKAIKIYLTFKQINIKKA